MADATVEDIESWIAGMRADGLASSTIARRVSAVRTYFRHLVLIGAKSENPAASVQLPRGPRTLPRALSPAETERSSTPPSGRPRARFVTARSSSSSTAPGCACRRQPGSKATSPSRSASFASSGRAGEGAARAARTTRRGGRSPLPRARSPPPRSPLPPGLFLNARGGALHEPVRFSSCASSRSARGLELQAASISSRVADLLRHSFDTPRHTSSEAPTSLRSGDAPAADLGTPPGRRNTRSPPDPRRHLGASRCAHWLRKSWACEAEAPGDRAPRNSSSRPRALTSSTSDPS